MHLKLSQIRQQEDQSSIKQNRSTHRIVQPPMDYKLKVVTTKHCKILAMLSFIIWQCTLSFVSQTQLEIVITANKKLRDLSHHKHRQWIKNPIS